MFAKVCEVAVEIYSSLMGYVLFSTKELLRLPCAVVVLDSVHATLAVDSIGRVRLQCMALDPLGSTPSAIWPIRGCAAGQSMVFVLSFLNIAYNFARVCP